MISKQHHMQLVPNQIDNLVCLLSAYDICISLANKTPLSILLIVNHEFYVSISTTDNSTWWHVNVDNSVVNSNQTLEMIILWV